MIAADPVTVKLHRTLYVQEGVTAAAAAFADFASFDVREDGDYYVVDVRDINRDVEGDVVAEFCNFALANSASLSTGASGAAA